MRNIDNMNWAGIDNIHSNIEMNAVHSGDTGIRRYLVNATNVDITDSGDIVRRQGTVRRATGAHSGGFGFFHWLITIKNGTLVGYDTGTWAAKSIAGVTGTEIGHCQIGEELYLSDGKNQWRVDKNLSVLPDKWGPDISKADPEKSTTLDPDRLKSFPPCSKLAHINGRIFGVLDNLVIYTEPYMYSVWDPSRNFYQFPADVGFLFANFQVLVVSADKTYIIDAPGTDNAVQTPALPFPSPSCDPAIDMESKTAYWLTERGWVSIGESDKMLKMLNYSTLATVRHKSAAVGIIKTSSLTSVVAVGVPDPNYPDVNPLVSKDYLESERNRKEV